MVTNINELDFTKQYTYADYLTWHFKERVELIKGWIHQMSPAPLDRHQRIASNLHRDIAYFFKRKGCQVRPAPYDVRLPNKRKSTEDANITTVVQPDICVICDPAKIDRKGCMGAPDWILEILSPGNSKTEMQDKFQLYEENGVQEYWIVQPEHESILQFVLQNEKYQLVKMHSGKAVVTPMLFPELEILLEDIF